MYKVLKNLITPGHAEKLACIIRNQPTQEDDPQVPGSYSYYCIPALNTLLGTLLNDVSKAASKTLLPSYTYCRVYHRGNELKPHVDRPSCEWSVTLNLSQTHEWPIYMGSEEIVIGVCDGVLYQGERLEHYRKPFEGDEYIQVFLHYVDANGPHAKHMYDTKTVTTELSFPIKYENHFIDNWCTIETAFSRDECDRIIKKFSGSSLEHAMVGDYTGALDKTIRKSRVHWIPKTHENSWIYERIRKLVAECNNEMFKFEITDIGRRIQFTEYDGGYYDWHVDAGGSDYDRKLSVSVQLSDPHSYEGGQLEFWGEDKIACRLKGSMTIFPSYKMHRVSPITSGCRYSLVIWVTGPHFR
jgi:PKHD-type hydroxylase